MTIKEIRGTVQSAHDTLAALLALDSPAAWDIVGSAIRELTDMSVGLATLLEDARNAAASEDDVLVASGVSPRRLRLKNMTSHERTQLLAKANWRGARSQLVETDLSGVPVNIGRSEQSGWSLVPANL